MDFPGILTRPGSLRSGIAYSMLVPILLVGFLSGLPHHHVQGLDHVPPLRGSDSGPNLGTPSQWKASGSGRLCPACLHHRISWGESSSSRSDERLTVSPYPTLVFGPILDWAHPHRLASPRAPPRG